VKKTLTLTVLDLASDGHGIARSGRDVYFIPGALPGEIVVAEMLERKRKVWYCRLISIEQVSEHRVEPACPHYKRCGGCDLQHLSYEKQVELKQQRVERELSRQGVEVERDGMSLWQSPIIADDQRWHYRRRARLGIRYNKAGSDVVIGFREGSSKHLVAIDSCPVLVEHPALDWKAWRKRLLQLEGISRFTHIEVLQASQRLVLVFRVLKKLTEHDRQCLQGWASELDIDIYIRPDDEQPLEAVNDHVSPLTHHVLGHDLSIHPDYFVQVNAKVNQLMVAEAKSWLAPEAGSRVWDLFAGHGNFSVPLAESAFVDAVEVSDEMVAAIEFHSQQLGCSAESGLIAHKADLSSSESLSLLPDPDYVLLDPPRAGADACMSELLKRKAKRMVYVSCDPSTLARDLNTLSKGFDVERISILDMFPHTHHIETMVLLVPARKSSQQRNKGESNKRINTQLNSKPKLNTQSKNKEKGASRGKSKR
jgi:23S rRNA (uracil1939-C5)-methyltransferase